MGCDGRTDGGGGGAVRARAVCVRACVRVWVWVRGCECKECGERLVDDLPPGPSGYRGSAGRAGPRRGEGSIRFQVSQGGRGVAGGVCVRRGARKQGRRRRRQREAAASMAHLLNGTRRSCPARRARNSSLWETGQYHTTSRKMCKRNWPHLCIWNRPAMCEFTRTSWQIWEVVSIPSTIKPQVIASSLQESWPSSSQTRVSFEPWPRSKLSNRFPLLLSRAFKTAVCTLMKASLISRLTCGDR